MEMQCAIIIWSRWEFDDETMPQGLGINFDFENSKPSPHPVQGGEDWVHYGQISELA